MQKTNRITALLCLLTGALGLFSVAGYGQNPFPCPQNPAMVTTNPDFPGCKAPGSGPFRILLVLDESGSIATAGATNTVRQSIRDFAVAVNNGTEGANKIKIGIVEFSSGSTYVFQMKDIKDGDFFTKLDNYRNTQYNPGGETNYKMALTVARDEVVNKEGANLIFFITDGEPTIDENPNTWRPIANEIKCKNTYIFGVGVGNSSAALDVNIQTLSGPDLLSPTVTLQNGADWTRQSFTNLGPLLVQLANSLIDTQGPSMTCPPNMQRDNDPKVCFAKVEFDPKPTDNCEVASLVCTPPSNSFFPVGATTVTCKATDKVGNTSTCKFIITVQDIEPPVMICPDPVTVSCEIKLEPVNTGDPTTLDNCAIEKVSFTDTRIDGVCANEYIMMRKWTAQDIHFNTSSCIQKITVEDKTNPIITCPADITVTCDLSTTTTGMATATDNCTVRPDISFSDQHISGDCEWFCITDRSFVAKDECLNTSKCVQRITKDVTPLIVQALTPNPLVLGQSGATVTLTQERAACVVQWLPYSGTTPKALPFNDAVASVDCKLMSNPIDANGRIENPLLGETMKLSLVVRLKPEIGARLLSSFSCPLPMIVKQGLAPNPTVNELLRVTNLTLGNVNVSLNVPAHALELLNYIKCINGNFTVCKL